MKLLSKFLPFIRGLYVAVSTILYCGVTIVFSLIYYLLAILAMQKDLVSGGALFIDILLNIQSSAFISSLKLAVIFFIPVFLADIFWGTRSAHISGLKRLHLLVVRSVTAGVFYGSMYYFALHKPEILYDGVMIHFLHFLLATYLFTLLFRDIIEDFTGCREPFTLRQYLNALDKTTYVEIVENVTSDGVYTAGELLEKEPGYLNCVIDPNSISFGRDVASNCIAMDSKERSKGFEIIENIDISYLAIEVKPPITKVTPSKDISIKEEKGDTGSIVNGLTREIDPYNFMDYIDEKEDEKKSSLENVFSLPQDFNLDNAINLEFRVRLIKKSMDFGNITLLLFQILAGSSIQV